MRQQRVIMARPTGFEPVASCSGGGTGKCLRTNYLQQVTQTILPFKITEKPTEYVADSVVTQTACAGPELGIARTEHPCQASGGRWSARSVMTLLRGQTSICNLRTAAPIQPAGALRRPGASQSLPACSAASGCCRSGLPSPSVSGTPESPAG